MFSNKPVRSLKDSVYRPPISGIEDFLVCTPHEYDHTIYKDLPSLVNAVIGLWWNVPHVIDPEWENLTQDQCLSHPWEGLSTLRKVLNSYSRFDTNFDLLRATGPSPFSRIKRKPWPGKFVKSTLQPDSIKV